MALIEKISRSVDNISADLDEEGQQRTHERLEALSAASSAWPDRVARLSETLTGSHGSSALALQSLALASERAASEPSWKRVAMPALESMTSCAALSARRKSFVATWRRCARPSAPSKAEAVRSQSPFARRDPRHSASATRSNALIAKDSSCSGRQSCLITIQQNSRLHHRASASVSWYEGRSSSGPPPECIQGPPHIEQGGGRERLSGTWWRILATGRRFQRLSGMAEARLK
jgi:hypothetical protein